MDANKQAAIGAAILAKMAEGLDVRQAFDAVLGAGMFERLAGELWDEFQENKKDRKPFLPASVE